MSVRRFPQPDTMRRGIAGTCKWCGRADVKKPAIYWHRECVNEYHLHTDMSVQYSFLCQRDGEKCAICGDRPVQWVRKGEFGNGQWAEPFPWEGSRDTPEYVDALRAFRREHPYPRYTSVSLRIGLDVDHKVPLWSVSHLPDDERRRYFGPVNLWLLCTKHHKEKTAKEAAERALIRKSAKSAALKAACTPTTTDRQGE